MSMLASASAEATNRPKQIPPPRVSTRWAVRLLLILSIGGAGLPLRADDGAQRAIAGVVLDASTSQPIPNVLVCVASPALDLRGVRDQRAGLFDGRTDPQGRFRIQVPFNPKISLNAFAPGYGEAAGPWMSVDTALSRVPFLASPAQEFVIKLQPALFVAGIITDESGRPFPEVNVEATLRQQYAVSYLEFATTDAQGRFELFDFPHDRWNADALGRLTFRNPAALTRELQDVYTLTESERTNLQISLSSGHAIRGQVTSAAGQPLASLVVEASPATELPAERTSLTDDQGRFQLRGLPDGGVNVRAHTAAFDAQARQQVQLTGADVELNLRLGPVSLKAPPKPVHWLGMKLADVTPELQSVYDLDAATGVLILDPGDQSARLGLGTLSVGDRFWIVGNREVKNLKEMVAELLRLSALARPADPNEGSRGNIRVVYCYRSRGGTMTQWLKLTEADVAELKHFQLTANP